MGPDSSLEILNLNHGKALAEINPLHVWVIAKLLGSAGTENPAFVDDVSTIGNREGLAHVVVGDQNTNAAGLKIGDDLLKLEHGNRINPGKRLVKQDERRRNTEATRDLDAATFSTRQSVSAILADNPKTELIDERFHALTTLVPRDWLGFQHRQDIVLDGELTEDRRLLRQVADTEVPGTKLHRNIGNFLIVDDYASGVSGN